MSALRGTLAAGGLWVLVVDLLPVRPGETNWSRWLDVRGMLDSIALISALALTATVPQPVDQWPLTSNQCGPIVCFWGRLWGRWLVVLVILSCLAGLSLLPPLDPMPLSESLGIRSWAVLAIQDACLASTLSFVLLAVGILLRIGIVPSISALVVCALYVVCITNPGRNLLALAVDRENSARCIGRNMFMGLVVITTAGLLVSAMRGRSHRIRDAHTIGCSPEQRSGGGE